jgi:hypothetical protein
MSWATSRLSQKPLDPLNDVVIGQPAVTTLAPGFCRPLYEALTPRKTVSFHSVAVLSDPTQRRCTL